MLIDTHCHLDDRSLLSRLPEVLSAARAAGVEKFIVPGVAPEGWDVIARLADADVGVYPACGLHPMAADRFDEALPEKLRPFARRGVAIGEIGLDYLVTDVPRDRQQAAFRAQLRLAAEMGLPVLIHCRKAFRDLLDILGEEHAGRTGGVMHAFSGSPEIARECIDLGFLISIAGTLTYANAVRPLEIVRQIPLEFLVLETDAPDMTPEPHRGGTNEPAFLVEIARKVAEIKGVSVEEVARVTSANAEKIFRMESMR
jgi:TatD DNase family protein